MAFTNPIFPIPSIAQTPELAQPLAFGPNKVVAMFPVRLETRFFQLLSGGSELRVRIYPDKIHMDVHEPELTEQEVIWGKHFWDQTWRAMDDEEAKKAAWRQLAERFGSNRAAWVARALKPLNPDARPRPPFNPGDPLPTPISFPTVVTKAESWMRAPVSHGLPKRWWVLGYTGGSLVTHKMGNLIPDKLQTGPDPSAPVTTIPDWEVPVDPGMKWLVNFDEAERVGMGVRIPLTLSQATTGFDILLVLGVKSDINLTDSTEELKQLLDGHHYTDGISFVSPGTPTNNTADAPSGFNSTDPGEEQSYQAERAISARPDDGSNSDVLSTALGLRDGNAMVLANLANGDAREQVDARHMNRALWPATWGYFLGQMMSGAPIFSEDIAWAKRHFVDHVRALGPLPTIRLGKQPYGILPVTSLNLWKPKAGQEAQFSRDQKLKDFLITLRGVWHQNLNEVPRIGRSNSPEQDLTDILSMDGVSSNYAIRHLIGENYLRTLWNHLVQGDKTHWWRKQRELTRAGLSRVGLNWDPMLSGSTYTGWSQTLKGPAVQPEMLSEDAMLSPNYISLLLNETNLEKLRTETFGQFQPKGLLYSLLRQAMLLEYWGAALNLSSQRLIDSGLIASVFEWEMYGIGGTPKTVWELLNGPAAAGITNGPLWPFLFNLDSVPDNPAIQMRVAPVREMRESLTHLQSVSARKLERLSAGTLDLCSHRLDAWITSFATKRLAEIRRTNPTGILLGGYGWVTNLKAAPHPGFESRVGSELGELLKLPNNPGYTHTPSLNQAATVAVLRNGHLTNSNTTAGDLLAIDLSSERVSLAKWLLDGVRQGQPLGALLGYRFERRLQQARLGEFIPFFRDLSPLVARKLEQTNDQAGQSVESIAANNVADGLDLQRKWKAIPRPAPSGTSLVQLLFAPLEKQPNPQRLQQARPLLEAELDLLDDAVDAVSDALIAESVHHAVQGNPLRTASTLDAIATGEAPPPELEVVRTPRTGSALTHRVVALFGGSASLAPEWGTPVVAHRAAAEPYLNLWASKLLGKPGKVRCLVERLDPSTGQVVETKELRLNELGLAPLDFIYAAEGNRNAQPSEIELRVLYTITRKPGGFNEDALIRINPGRGAGWPATDLSYGEFVELLRATRKLITSSRGIDGSELDLPELNRPPAIDITELQGRANIAEVALRSAVTDLENQIAAAGSANLDALRVAILRAAHFGVPGSVPISPVGDTTEDREALSFQAASVAGELNLRVDQVEALNAGFDPASATESDKRDHHIARMRVIFGESFVVLPRFSASNPDDLEKALADSTKAQGGDPMAAVTWFERASRVREGSARLNASLSYSDALGTGERLSLKVAQLPYRQNDRWVALPIIPGQSLSPSRFSMVVQSTTPLNVRQPLAGVLIDEWVEVVPGSVETTGIVFQYDQPDSAPPQAILLAVPPDPDAQWNVWSLQQVLLETLDLARVRAVDPDSLDEVGHYLPALYIAANTQADTVSIDFSKLKLA